MDHRLEILHAHSSVTTRALSFHLVSFRERKRVIYISGGIGKGEESSEERSEREREGERERHAHAIVPVADSTSRRAARAANLLPPLRTKLQSR